MTTLQITGILLFIGIVAFSAYVAHVIVKEICSWGEKR